MNDAPRTVFDDAIVYADNGSIVDVLGPGVSAPAGFENTTVIDTGGTIYPGLIELHNHLPYDVLPLWHVPKRYGNRDQWGGSNPDYRRLITGPMQAIGSAPATVAAIVRYIELRCLLGGTTTSQGVTLAKSKVTVTHFHGLVRNVEATGDAELPNAATHVADVAVKDAETFLEAISGKKKKILHLAEGTDTAAHNHFAALQIGQGKWAITNNLIGIHCVALNDEDFNVFAAHGGSMVWSPFSNLLLYGQTADLAAALKHKVPVALGSDWSPSGSKNLLGELKVARLAAPLSGAVVSDEDLVAMATCMPASMLGWDKHIGTVQQKRRADLLVVRGRTGDPYSSLIDATEALIDLVVINGVPRAGSTAIMTALGLTAGTENLSVGGQTKVLNLAQKTASPDVGAVSAADAQSTLHQALADLPNGARTAAFAALPDDHIRLAVEGLVDNGMTSRPHLLYHGEITGADYKPPGESSLMMAAPPEPLPSITLDPLAAADTPGFYDTIKNEANLPAAVRDGLVKFKPGK